MADHSWSTRSFARATRLLILALSCGVLAACGEDDDPPSEPQTMTVSIGGVDARVLDTEYVSRRYFMLPELTTVNSGAYAEEVRLYRTTRDVAEENQNGRETARVIGSERGDGVGPRFEEDVVRLTFNEEYYVISDQRTPIATVILRDAVPDGSRLYTSFVLHRSGELAEIGNATTRGNDDPLEAAIVALTREDVEAGTLPSDVTGRMLGLEYRNIYNLESRDIDSRSLSLVIRRIGTTETEIIPGIPFLTATGLDVTHNSTGFGCVVAPSRSGSPHGSDGRVDQPSLDETNGLVFFPDPQPFDPDLSSLTPNDIRRMDCRTRAIGWELVDPTPGVPGDESYQRVGAAQQADERNEALYSTFRPGPADSKYEIVGTYEVPAGP